jgi:S-formylglutathione hydrolase FrmB
MGGYGALLLAEKYPHLITAVAAISPAIWRSGGPSRRRLSRQRWWSCRG